MVDGKNVLPLATSQDHKRLLDDDQGPNTGGMGAYSPAPVVTPTVYARIMRDVIQPAVAGLERDGTPYTGFLYAGLMIGADGERQGPGVQLPARRSGDPAHHDALERRLLQPARARRQRHTGPGRGGMGSAHRAGRRARGSRLSGRAADGRRHQRPAAGGGRFPRLPRGDRLARRHGGDDRRARAHRHRARRQRAHGAAPGLSGRAADRVRWLSDAPRHRRIAR